MLLQSCESERTKLQLVMNVCNKSMIVTLMHF